jgi:hypothetical protein
MSEPTTTTRTIKIPGPNHPITIERNPSNAVWTYEAPYDAVAAIRNYLAFYPERVDAIEERLETPWGERPKTAPAIIV